MEPTRIREYWITSGHDIRVEDARKGDISDEYQNVSASQNTLLAASLSVFRTESGEVFVEYHQNGSGMLADVRILIGLFLDDLALPPEHPRSFADPT